MYGKLQNIPWRKSTLAVLLAILIFAVDLQIPLGVAGGVPYVAVVLLGWWFPRRRHIFYLAVGSSALTVFGYFLSESGGIPWMIIANRFLALFAIWVTAALLNAAKLATDRLWKAHEDLEKRFEHRTRQLAKTADEQEATASALRIKDIRLAETQRIAKLGNWHRDIPADNLWWSKEVYRIFGVDRQRSTLEHKFFLARVHPDDRQFVTDTVDRGLKTGEPFNIDYRIVLEDGTEKTVHEIVEPVFDDDGELTGISGTVQDITERKKSETKSRRLLTAIESLSECVALYDENDCLVFCNAPYRELNRAVPETLVPGVPYAVHLKAILTKHLVPGSIGREAEWLEERLAHHRNPKGPLEVSRQDGRWFLAYEKRLEDGGYVSLMTDITEMKRVETERLQALVQAEKASRAKSGFLATMSHELRTPLNAIIGFAEIISREHFGPLGNPRYQEYAQDILSSSHHLLDLVNDVLDLSAIEAGKYSLTRELIEIPEVIEECFRTIAGAAKQKHISYTLDIPPILPPCYADRRGIKQILLNLLSNAVKYTSEGGSIRLSVVARGGHHTIEVIDNGQGIPASKMARLTNPFSRVETNPHKSEEGVGLGLSIVDSLLKLHGGELNIESELGNGTTVSVKLPTAER